MRKHIRYLFFALLPLALQSSSSEPEAIVDETCLLQSSRKAETAGPGVSEASLRTDSIKPSSGAKAVLADASQGAGVTSSVKANASSAANSSTANEESPSINSSGTVFDTIFNQIEFEVTGRSGAPPHKSKLAIVLLEFFFIASCCGVDRCYMGQACLGVVKGLTFGGLGIWFLIDYFVIIVNCINKRHQINNLGFYADWGTDHINAAFYIACVMLGFMACFVCCSCCSAVGAAAVGGPGKLPANERERT